MTKAEGLHHHRFVITNCYEWETAEDVEYNYKPVLEWIEHALASRQNVLCHCLAGAHRSAVMISCYLYWKEKRDAEWCLDIVKHRRAHAEPRVFAVALDVLRMWLDNQQ